MLTDDDDIFADWKNRRFVVVDYELMPELDIVVVLSDLSFWAPRVNELKDWCKDNGGEISGLTVSFKTQEQLTMFALRWS